MAKKAFVYDGTQWVDIAQSTADLSNYANLTTTPISGFRNKIINGDFDFWQRGTSTTVNSGSTVYFADRWMCYATGATMYPYRSSGLTGTSSQYAGYINGSAGNTATTFLQRIESSNVKLASGSTFTVSAKISSPGSRNVTIYVQSANAADNFSAKTAVGSSTVALVSGVNTVKVTFSATAACVNGIEVGFEFGALTSGTIALGQVQLEVGSIATPFEQRPIGTELALCQRYYCLLASGAGVNVGVGFWWNASFADTTVRFPVQMRATPVMDATSGTGYYAFGNSVAGSGSITAVTAGELSPYSVNLEVGVSGTTGVAGRLVTMNALSRIGFSAEL